MIQCQYDNDVFILDLAELFEEIQQSVNSAQDFISDLEQQDPPSWHSLSLSKMTVTFFGATVRFVRMLELFGKALPSLGAKDQLDVAASLQSRLQKLFQDIATLLRRGRHLAEALHRLEGRQEAAAAMVPQVRRL